MAKQFTPKNAKERQLRARFHDYNSQRRFRKQSTLSWQQYKQKTKQGTRKLR